MPTAADLADRLRLPFSDLRLLEQALIHSSYRNEHPDQAILCNERLEFLGDAVISIVVSEALYVRYPGEDEGALTARRAALVSTAGLARLAERLDLGEYVRLGMGADRANERRRDSILAATLEALAGAVYMELGLQAVRDWLLELAAPELGALREALSFKSAKSQLQELTYARTGRAPVYRVVSASGPDHAPRYIVEALLGSTVVGRGEGTSRREAETHAAKRGVEHLRINEPGDALTV